MKYQEHIIKETKKAAEEAFKYAKAVPQDKVEWTPLDNGRTILSLCREMAMCPGWAEDIVGSDKPHEWNEESMAAIEEEQKQWTTVEACEAECNRRLEKMFGLFRGIDDAGLEKTKWLPYDGGRDFTVAEMMDYPRWNFTYHLGQIAYIQTLYGDKDMH